MAGEDRAYTTWLKTLPCCIDGCRTMNVDAHHRTRCGIALRSHDHTAIPLCRLHHVELHTFSGHFRDWTRWARDDFQDAHAARCMQAYRDHMEDDAF